MRGDLTQVLKIHLNTSCRKQKVKKPFLLLAKERGMGAGEKSPAEALISSGPEAFMYTPWSIALHPALERRISGKLGVIYFWIL